jgi:hypothetical protein
MADVGGVGLVTATLSNATISSPRVGVGMIDWKICRLFVVFVIIVKEMPISGSCRFSPLWRGSAILPMLCTVAEFSWK